MTWLYNDACRVPTKYRDRSYKTCGTNWIWSFSHSHQYHTPFASSNLCRCLADHSAIIHSSHAYLIVSCKLELGRVNGSESSKKDGSSICSRICLAAYFFSIHELSCSNNLISLITNVEMAAKTGGERFECVNAGDQMKCNSSPNGESESTNILVIRNGLE